MSVNLYEIPITPVVDLYSDVVVSVPGYAKKGPLEPTLVTADTFKDIFGDSPYTFADGDNTSLSRNTMGKNAPDRGWLYAKGLLDAGLTVLYHRIPDNANTAYAITDYIGVTITPVTRKDGVDSTVPLPPHPTSGCTVKFRAKFPGASYTDFSVSVDSFSDGAQKLIVYKKNIVDGQEKQEKAQETYVSFNPDDPYFIGNPNVLNDLEIQFFYQGNEVDNLREEFSLDSLYSPDSTKFNPGYISLNLPSLPATSYILSIGSSATPEFTVSGLLTNLLGSTSPSKPSKLDVLTDTDTYPTVTYITSGGYYQTTGLAKKMLEVANKIKAIALIDLPQEVTDDRSQEEGIIKTLSDLGADPTDYIKGAAFVGADTFKFYEDKRIMADSYGYLTKLGKNLSQAIPAWIPVANVPQGVTSAVATTRPISYSKKAALIPPDNRGIAVNPIVYKQNSGYTIMGNRTLAKLNGVTEPDAFLNCQLVVNSVLRSARRAASNLLIVSTSPTTAFSTFYSAVSKTCEKMLVNGDGLAAYNIIKLKKTKPATIDIQIELTVVEGIETFNIYVPYQIALDA